MPIVLNIIDNAKKKSNLRSVEGYARVLEATLYDLKAQGKVELNDDGLYLASNAAQYTGTKVYCSIKKIENDKIILDSCKVGEEDGYCYKNGKAIYGDECTVNNNNDKPTAGIGIPVTEKSKTTGNIPSGSYSHGDEYIINVDETNSYHFFILSTDEYNVNLITDRNICSDGTIATSDNPCNVAWVNKTDYNDDISWDGGELGDYNIKNNKGPITAINYINESTKNWTNIPNLNVNYTDEGNKYGKIKTNGNITTITNIDGTTTATYINLKARLPMVSELSNEGCMISSGSCPLWLVNNLYRINSYYTNGASISNIYGYWTLSTSDRVFDAWLVNYYGSIRYPDIVKYVETYFGLRPVITTPKSNL